MGDLDTLNEWSNHLIKQSPSAGQISDLVYLQNIAIQVMIVSQLEYFLKSAGKIEKQGEIKKIIEQSELTKSEKIELKRLMLVRHTLVHNLGHFDEEFSKKINKLGLKFDLKETEKQRMLSPLAIETLPDYIKITKKLIDEIEKTRSAAVGI
ncbi:hypothetical protein COX86_03250 [Candidatus Micrarchaeota archaeon CG_4_10_14_0_2_um_filter_60_11]|nr:MAG: hypothetical protein COU39_04275 [Candidatus Micrarchaeota archaeon CG10_big_fil_rev_8_21_14_0_10_60_32]PIO01677.1 MAG: hypothetical protein COT58_03895 [Candidatus Micrarchaeota archaeon CG09_land_8_20_14_0_10_60_16]PIZ90768.1 MAG: hypothetical protein COX86_03250 [Candidatus Micrarchaeota archaeon CG_4_10_14_0_2_um_filter_60_11]